jgi:mannose-6-phosphate isomerase
MEPLRFTPILKRLRWGGRRLGSVLRKSIGAETDYAESWEVADHGADQSVVESGPDAGWTLGRLVRERGPELLGRHAGIDQFPLLLKYLDASDRLSVQVHPDDERARALCPGEGGKTEAWVILAAEPASCVYAGLNPGVTRESLAAALDSGAVEQCLHRVPVAAGDCLFIPAGTVHAIGEGVLLAEVQQSSDVTYRLFDWNRVGADGKPRALHIAHSLAATDFDRGPVTAVAPRILKDVPGHRLEQLVSCRYFTILRHTALDPVSLSADHRCHILMGLAGSVRVGPGDAPSSLARGGTVLIPSSALPCPLAPVEPSQFLEIVWD